MNEQILAKWEQEKTSILELQRTTALRINEIQTQIVKLCTTLNEIVHFQEKKIDEVISRFSEDIQKLALDARQQEKVVTSITQTPKIELSSHKKPVVITEEPKKPTSIKTEIKPVATPEKDKLSEIINDVIKSQPQSVTQPVDHFVHHDDILLLDKHLYKQLDLIHGTFKIPNQEKQQLKSLFESNERLLHRVLFAAVKSDSLSVHELFGKMSTAASTLWYNDYLKPQLSTSPLYSDKALLFDASDVINSREYAMLSNSSDKVFTWPTFQVVLLRTTKYLLHGSQLSAVLLDKHTDIELPTPSSRIEFEQNKNLPVSNTQDTLHESKSTELKDAVRAFGNWLSTKSQGVPNLYFVVCAEGDQVSEFEAAWNDESLYKKNGTYDMKRILFVKWNDVVLDLIKTRKIPIDIAQGISTSQLIKGLYQSKFIKIPATVKVIQTLHKEDNLWSGASRSQKYFSALLVMLTALYRDGISYRQAIVRIIHYALRYVYHH